MKYVYGITYDLKMETMLIIKETKKTVLLREWSSAYQKQRLRKNKDRIAFNKEDAIRYKIEELESELDELQKQINEVKAEIDEVQRIQDDG